ncbi:chain-length determining protein [Phocaeicola coprophilus]|uniref:chain-length determining protein n=1 Tax=Phocaeicola coprophilus TaxID=387090 RepID=UPI00255CFB5F|nr:chain-length determining protein [Phocaeicola coprophilus]
MINLNQRFSDPNFLSMLTRLKEKRAIILKSFIGSLIISIIIAFSIPKEYTVKITLSPESGSPNNNSITGMASMLGLGNISNGLGDDALNMTLFSEILSSTPFAIELYQMPVRYENSNSTTPFYKYIKSQKKPWWKYIFNISLFSDSNKQEDHPINPFKLTNKEQNILSKIKQSIKTDIDKKTGISSISVSLQDPYITATVTDSVINKLQAYIIKYRTKKAKEYYVYLKGVYEERKKEYYEAQKKYANYIDSNRNILLQSSKIEEERLLAETNLKYQIYSQIATQLELAKAKIQEEKPVFEIIEPATIPTIASAPNKKIIVIGIVFFSMFITISWIILGCGEIITNIKNKLI